MRIEAVQRFTADVTALKGTVPQQITDLLAASDAVRDWQPPRPGSALRQAIGSGEFTPATAENYLETAALELAGIDGNRNARAEAEQAIETALEKRLAEHAEQILRSLDPAYEKAVDGIHGAAAHFSYDAKAEDVLEMPAAAVKAWQALPGHRSVLDRIYGLTSWIAVDGQGPQLVPLSPMNDVHGFEAVAACWLPEGASAESLRNAAAAADPLRSNQLRAGRWHRLLAGGIAAPSVERARNTIAGLESARLEAARVRKQEAEAMLRQQEAKAG